MEKSDWVLVYLNRLPMLFEDVHPHHSFVELWIQRLNDFIVKVLLKIQKQTWRYICSWHVYYNYYREDAQHNLPDTAERQILWRWTQTWFAGCLGSVRLQRCWNSCTRKNVTQSFPISEDNTTHKNNIFIELLNISVPKSHSSSDSQPQCCRLSATTGSCQSYSAPQGLLWDCFNKLQHCLCLEYMTDFETDNCDTRRCGTIEKNCHNPWTPHAGYLKSLIISIMYMNMHMH